MRLNKWRWVILISFIIEALQPLSVHADSGPSTQTQGSIGFYGQYPSENDPLPIPPNGSHEELPPLNDSESFEAEDLPQANQLSYNGWSGLGLIILMIAIIIKREKWRNKNEKIINVN